MVTAVYIGIIVAPTTLNVIHGIKKFFRLLAELPRVRG